MGRYKSQQFYPDTATAKVRVEGLAEAAPSAWLGEDAAGQEGSRDGSSSAGDAPRALAPPKPDKIEHAVGSTAGAASSEFHLYRASRRREYTRIEMLDKAAAEAKEAANFADKVDSNKRDADERTSKLADKRRKRKFNAKKNSNLNKAAKGADGGKMAPDLAVLSDEEESGGDGAAGAGAGVVAGSAADDATTIRLLLQRSD